MKEDNDLPGAVGGLTGKTTNCYVLKLKLFQVCSFGFSLISFSFQENIQTHVHKRRPVQFTALTEMCITVTEIIFIPAFRNECKMLISVHSRSYIEK